MNREHPETCYPYLQVKYALILKHTSKFTFVYRKKAPAHAMYSSTLLWQRNLPLGKLERYKLSKCLYAI